MKIRRCDHNLKNGAAMTYYFSMLVYIIFHWVLDLEGEPGARAWCESNKRFMPCFILRKRTRNVK